MKNIVPLALLCGALPLAAHASGSYTARPPRPPAQKDAATAIDNEKYALGKSIYTGKAKLKATPDASAAAQAVRLKELSGKLPKSSAKEAEKLASLAGKLSAQELEALEYYVGQRYKTK